MTGDLWLYLMQHTVDKEESGTIMRYGVPVAIRPLERIAAQLSIRPSDLVLAMRKEPHHDGSDRAGRRPAFPAATVPCPQCETARRPGSLAV